MSDIKLPRRDSSRPPFIRDPNFVPRCYEFRVLVERPAPLWSDDELCACNNLPRIEPGVFLSFRESGRSHTIVWCRPDQWTQWQDASVFGDGRPGAFDRSTVDLWSDRDFCLVRAAELFRDNGHLVHFPRGVFSPVPYFSPGALEIWSAVRPLGKDGKKAGKRKRKRAAEIFGRGFSPARNPGGLH